MTFKLPIFPFDITYKSVFILLSIILGLLMPYLSLDYGVIEDSRYHQEHGVRLLNYFKGVDDVAGQSPINEAGNFVDVNKSIAHEHRGMNGFGGFFDLLTNFLHQFAGNTGIYEFRNFINGIFGFLLFLFCGLLGKTFGGWKTGVTVFVFVVLTPVLFGHSMYNPKDIPFAAFYVFSLFHSVKLVKELPVITVKRSLFLILNMSLLINIRIVGLVMLGHLFVAVFLWWFFENYKDGFQKVRYRETLFLAAKILGICCLGYLATSIFWPYLHANPVVNPIELFFKTKAFKGFENIQLFEGTWQTSFNMPWYYMLSVLFILTLPLHSLIGILLIPIVYFKKVKIDKVLVSFIAFTSLFPLLLILLGGANSYDNGRQFLFVVPPLLILGALAWEALFSMISHNDILRKGVYLLFLLLLLEPFTFLLKNHPLHSLYYGPLVGGMEGAYQQYEIDYWGIGVKPAIDWLEDHIEETSSPTRVRMYYGDQIKLRYHTEKIPSLDYVAAPPNSADWEYSIVMLAEAKHRRTLVGNWPPEHTVHEVKVDGVTVAAIVKNTFVPKDATVALEQQLLKAPTSAGYIRLSLMYFHKKAYLKSIMASKKAIAIDEKNSVAYNNLCSAYNMLLMYDRAKEACENSLNYAPSTLAVNNLKMAQDGIAKEKREGLTNAQYTGLSYNYYQLQDFEGCIRASKAMLLSDPKNYVAYNNICASYNSLQNFEQAAMACQKALELNPDSQLAKNNLKYSQESLSK